MPLTPDQQRQRELKLTASMVGPLMNGSTEDIINLWRAMIGDPDYVPDDLTWVWPVQLGSVTEELNLRFYQFNTGHAISRQGEVVTNPFNTWAACTLDAWDDTDGHAVEAKHVGGFEERDKVIRRYMPQFHWIMSCTGTDRIALSLIEGARPPVIEIIDYNTGYAGQLWSRAQVFMQHVWNMTPPVQLQPVEAPVKAVRTVDMGQHNQWCVEAETWLANRIAARDHAAAAKTLKELVPADAARCYGAGIEISRSRANALTIKERRN
jgi:YqaJ-like viral recombinase domain